MTARKTASVAKMLHMANSYLASAGSDRDGRAAIANFIEGVLHDTGNYRGFSVKESPEIAPYSAEAPVRHFYFPSGAIAAEYDAIAASV